MPHSSCNRKLEKFFTNSVWIVPKSTLLAYLMVDGIAKPVKDQTVWVVNGYKDGYIFGQSFTALDKAPFSTDIFYGSITPEGKVLLTFQGNSTNTGIGTFNHQRFTMQINAGSLTHWSYMKNVVPSDCDYQKLPGVGISIPEFISLFNY